MCSCAHETSGFAVERPRSVERAPRGAGPRALRGPRIVDNTRHGRDLIVSRLKQSCFATALSVIQLDIKSIVLRPWHLCVRK